MNKLYGAVGTIAVLMAILVAPVFAFADDGEKNREKERHTFETKVDAKIAALTKWVGKHGEKHQGENASLAIRGTVSAVASSTVTVKGKDDKMYTVLAGGATIKSIATSSASTISVSDIKVNDSIFALGTATGTTITAKHIIVGNWNTISDLEKKKAVAKGTVIQINGDTITLTNKKMGTTTVATASSTVYRLNGVATTSAALAVGSKVRITGTTTGTTTASATIVDIVTKGLRFVKHTCFGWMK